MLNQHSALDWRHAYLIVQQEKNKSFPVSNVHGAHMGPNWDLSAPGGPHVGLMNRAIWVYLQTKFCPLLALPSEGARETGVYSSAGNILVMTMIDETLTIGESALLSYDLRKTANCNWKANHDDVIKWKHFPRYWPFVRGIHRSPVNSLRKGMWRRDLVFSLICALN